MLAYAGMLVQPSNLEQPQQEALLASAFPQLPGSFLREVARQTCASSQAVSAFGHICQVRPCMHALCCISEFPSKLVCC